MPSKISKKHAYPQKQTKRLGVASGRARRNSERIFIVHGHDEETRRALVRFLIGFRKEPIVLAELPSGGRTIIEKFEHYATGIDYAVVLMTRDDIGGLRNKSGPDQVRARQNVIFELGYFTGKLGRGKVCLLSTSDIEMPSDLHGIAYLSLDDTKKWPWLFLDELRAAGIYCDPEAVGPGCRTLLSDVDIARSRGRR